MFLLEAAGTLRRGPLVTGEVENKKKSKNFDGHVETIPLIPHNLGFVLTPETTLLGGRRDPSEGT